MNHNVVLILALFLNVVSYYIFAAMLSNRRNVIAITPKLPSPQLLFNLRHPRKDLSSRNALNYLYHFLWLIRRYRLHYKMDMISICSYLKKMHLIPFGYLQTNQFQLLINPDVKHHSSILCWTNNMIYQYRHVMAFMQIQTHNLNSITLSQQAAGN